jgi:hypothetical protein
VHRRPAGIELRRLPPEQFHWLRALMAGTPLGRLVERDAGSGADSAGWLAHWAARGVIHSFVLTMPADS